MIGVDKPLPGVAYPSHEALRRYADGGVIGSRTLAGALREALKKHAERVALSDAFGEMTYAQLDEQSDRLALGMSRLGLEPLDRVLYQLPNSRETIISLLACWKANLIPLCTLEAHREMEIGYLGDHAGAAAHMIRTDKENFDFADFARKMQAERIKSIRTIIVARGETPEGMTSMQALIDNSDPDEAAAFVASIDFDPYQTVVFQLSGGTTSVPKIIPHFSNSYLHSMEAMAERLDYHCDDVIFMPLQMIHNSAMQCFIFPALLRGAEFAIASSIEPAEIFRILTQRKPTFFGLAGGALGRLSAINPKEVFDFSKVRGVFSTNAARQIEQQLDVKGLHLFGMTEGMLIFPRLTDSRGARFATVGRPVSPMDEVRIVRPGSEEDLPVGEVGELLVKGPYLFGGYYDAPERNREVFTSDGFYRTGDLMSAREIDGEVHYAFEGRLKDVVSRGGEKINCEEVEMLVRRHPDIADVAVVPMPDRDYDERACAYLILMANKAAPTVKELVSFLSGLGLAKFKCPERIEVVSEFPMTKSGKLSKPILTEMISDKLAQEGRS